MNEKAESLVFKDTHTLLGIGEQKKYEHSVWNITSKIIKKKRTD